MSVRTRCSPGFLCILGALILVLGGCAAQQNKGDAVAPGPLPAASELVRLHDARLERLDRLWARISIVVEGVDRNGAPVREQAEGFLMVVRPDRAAVIITKLGDTYFYLGSNAEQFWWIDVEKKHAVVGRQGTDDVLRVSEFGVPVPPSELPSLLGLTRLAPLGEFSVARVPAGAALSRSASRQVVVDPVTGAPRAVVVRDARGGVIMESRLSGEERVVLLEGGAEPRIAQRAIVSLPATKVRVTMTLYEPQNRGARMPMAAFDLPGLLERHGVASVQRIDQAAPPRPTGREALP